MENCDIRNLKKEDVWEKIDMIVVDVSFIWLAKILDSLLNLSSEKTELILLFKPQFEVGKINMKKTWVPKDAKVIIAALEKFRIVCKEKNLRTTKISESKLPGEAGNIEYFIHLNCSILFSEWLQKS
jgi:23S rRNA (cytidine1920-2'-O)/16S rRNA (cytidine1409-2'-O)-methyltransferase